MLPSDFGSTTKCIAVQADIDLWIKHYPEAATSLQALWEQHVMEVGHKRLGRALQGKDLRAKED